jgi:hypothetical protein
MNFRMMPVSRRAMGFMPYNYLPNAMWCCDRLEVMQHPAEF